MLDAASALKSFLKRWWIVIIIPTLCIVVFAVFLGYEFLVKLPEAKQVTTQLEIELNAIAHLPNADVVAHSSSYDPGRALVNAKYSTDSRSEDVFKYYDEQLRQHGWQFYQTKGMKDWGRDLGGKLVDYCKGDYEAELFYAGQKANYGWTYSLDMSWGLHDYCKAGK